MISKTKYLFLWVLLSVPLIAFGTTTPEQVVYSFQKLPHYEMFCRDENWRSAEPIKTGRKFQPYLSKEFYKLFLWEECGYPDIPPHDKSSRSGINWDIRFSLYTDSPIIIVQNIRVLTAKFHGADKAVVKVLFDVRTRNVKNVVTTYTLIREDGQWKIDDIAPQGDIPEDNDQEPFLIDHSDSIKTDMQNNYNAAMARYKQEQAKTGAATKP